MKIRSGFVSNSSSASFVVIWKKHCEDWTLQENIEDLFEWADTSKKYIDDIIAETVETHQMHYKTTFFTTMFNGVDDFGEAATRLVAAAAIKGQLVDSITLED